MIVTRACGPLVYPEGHLAMLVGVIAVLPGGTAGCSSPLETCVMPSGTMESSPEGEGSQVSWRWGSLGPVSDVKSVFSNRDVSSTSGGTRAQQEPAIGEYLGQP